MTSCHVTHRYTSKRVRELWWFGLPPGIRGTVWRKAIGNELNISQGILSSKFVKLLRFVLENIYR